MAHGVCSVKAKIHYTSFPVASAQQDSNFPTVLYGEGTGIYVCNGLHRFDTIYRRLTDRQTDRRTDIPIMAITTFYI